MKSLEEILNETEKLQCQINLLLKEVDKLQKITFKNIICNQERNINKILLKIQYLQGRVQSLMWVLT